jgi:predicted AAA+ superfamily ATPase
MEELQQYSRDIINRTDVSFTRSLMKTINWKSRLIGVKGSRGVGKTTLLLQYIKLNLEKELNSTLYVSLDHIYFSANTLVDMTKQFVNKGGKYLFLDEVHKYSNWSQELKNIYDMHPDLKIVFTGSSLLEILNARADLSRRAIVYTLNGLSFREFLNLQSESSFPKVTLKEILENHDAITNEVNQKVKPLKYFEQYLRYGYYPFFMEEINLYPSRLREVTNLMLEIELPLLRNLDLAYVTRIKQLLYIIANSAPFVPNVSKLAEKIGIQRSTLLNYLHFLDEVKLTRNLFKEGGGTSLLQKPQKIFLDNTNLMFALGGDQPDRGNIRETFFASQLGTSHELTYSPIGDFMVDKKYIFEVGGRNKGKKQLEGAENAFIAADDIGYGFQNKIPLWLFGFLY